MLIIFFIAGLIVGSFLNVIIYRLRIMENIMGRSYCPHSKHKIHWFDNIPLLSFILLGAKCRACKGDISWQYPLVEFLSGLIFLFTAKYFLIVGNTASYWETFFYLTIFSLLLVLMAYDWKFMEVPMIVFWVSLAVVAVYFIFSDYFSLRSGANAMDLRIVSGLIGGFIAWIFFFSLVFFSKEKWMGWGDVYVGALAGAILGWPGILLGLMLSFTFGAVYAIIIVAMGKKNMKSQVPFIPFLVLGTITAVFAGKFFPIAEYLYF
ncbi:MAG: prepilin peptidase [Parcubacteria group bacterium]